MGKLFVLARTVMAAIDGFSNSSNREKRERVLFDDLDLSKLKQKPTVSMRTSAKNW
jgi:hypothetical protein